MSKVKIQGNASGTGVLTVTAPNTNTDRTITLPDGDVTLGAATPSIDDNGNATAMTIDSSENVLIGKTTTALATAGLTLGESGFASITRDGYEPLNVNRLSSDGNVISVYKDSVVKGSIAVTGSGIGIQLGGTGTANTLDDYEEGTCTIQYSDGSTTVGDSNLSKYTKVGRLVTVTGYLNTTNIDSLSNGLAIRLTGFPFTNTTDTTFPYFTRFWDMPTGTINTVGYLPLGQTYCTFYAMKDNASYQQIICGDVGNSNDLYFGVSYHAS